jgi:hypothetical protein
MDFQDILPNLDTAKHIGDSKNEINDQVFQNETIVIFSNSDILEKLSRINFPNVKAILILETEISDFKPPKDFETVTWLTDVKIQSSSKEFNDQRTIIPSEFVQIISKHLERARNVSKIPEELVYEF